jgi:hypothetical protein
MLPPGGRDWQLIYPNWGPPLGQPPATYTHTMTVSSRRAMLVTLTPTHHTGTQKDDSQHNDIRHKGSQHIGIATINIMPLSIMALSLHSIMVLCMKTLRKMTNTIT